MTSLISRFDRVVRSWVSGGGSGIRRRLRSLDVARSAERLRQQLREDTCQWTLGSVADLLNALSLLVRQMAQETEASLSIIRDGSAAFRLLSSAPIQSDEYGERAELLRQLAFLLWRHSRLVHGPAAAQEWAEEFASLVNAGSVSQECLGYFLETPIEARSTMLNSSFLLDAETLFLVCASARRRRNIDPQTVSPSLLSIHEWVLNFFQPKSFPDEREYFLAQLELSIGTCRRWAGLRGEALLWIDRAQDRATGLPDSVVLLAEAEAHRLCTWHEMGRHEDVLGRLPALQSTFRALGMRSSLVRSELLLGGSLIVMGRGQEATEAIQRALQDPLLIEDGSLRAFALSILTDSYMLQGRFGEALEVARQALTVLDEEDVPQFGR